MAQPKLRDSALRAVTDDGAFRVITVRTTDIVRRMLAIRSLWGADAVQLAELVTGTILVRETMAPTHRVQGLLRSADGASLFIGDSDPDGGARGLHTRKSTIAPASIMSKAPKNSPARSSAGSSCASAITTSPVSTSTIRA